MKRTTMAAAFALAFGLAPAGVLAQDDMSADDMMGSMTPHPSHIHVGLCPTPGDVIAPLSDVSAIGGDLVGAESSIHVDAGITTVELALTDILAADHAIVVHASKDDMGTFIACADIGGHYIGDSVPVGIGPVGDSGFSGVAWLTDNGDGTTEVSVFLTHSGASAMSMDDDMDDDDMDDDDRTTTTWTRRTTTRSRFDVEGRSTGRLGRILPPWRPDRAVLCQPCTGGLLGRLLEPRHGQLTSGGTRWRSA